MVWKVYKAAGSGEVPITLCSEGLIPSTIQFQNFPPAEALCTMPDMMRAAVIHKAGAPDALQLEDRPIPEPENGQILIKVHAFGLNRSELFTRQGLSPGGRLILIFFFLPTSSTTISSMGSKGPFVSWVKGL